MSAGYKCVCARTRRYEDGYDGSEQVIRWFWEAVEAYSDTQRRMLLQFWSGSDGQPPEGFGALDPPFHLVRIHEHC